MAKTPSGRTGAAKANLRYRRFVRAEQFKISEQLVARLLAEQHPDLADLGLRPTHPGWNNSVWRLGERLAVRLPQHRAAAVLTEKEIRWLPVVSPRLSLPVPAVVRRGEPSPEFPVPWYVAEWVEGLPADRAPIWDGERAANPLADFLGALHRPAPSDAPVNPTRGGNLAELEAEFEGRLTDTEDQVDATGLCAVWIDACAASPWTGPSVWLHGDLHPANVTIADGSIAGVIDFGDLCSGDSAYDLAAAWLVLPDAAQGRFFDAYGATDDGLLRRARGWAALTALGFLTIGRADERDAPGGRATWAPPARSAVRQLTIRA